MFWHSCSTLFKGCISFEVLCTEPSFTSMKPPIGFGGNLALPDWRERLLSRPWGWRERLLSTPWGWRERLLSRPSGWRDSNATISANMEQDSNIQTKRVVYSIVTVGHVVHDLYVNMYGSDKQPQHPCWHNQLAGGVVVMSDITQHIEFLSQHRQ